MRIPQLLSFIMVLLTCTTSSALITPPQSIVEQIQVPLCLASHIPQKYPVLAESASFKIIQVPSSELENITHIADKVACGRFLNISHRLLQKGKKIVTNEALIVQLQKPVIQSLSRENRYKIQHVQQVNDAIKKINSNELWEFLTYLTNFTNRSATKDTGLATAKWLKQTVDQMIIMNGRTDIESYFVATGPYKQPSLVMVMGKATEAPAVVIGAHMILWMASCLEQGMMQVARLHCLK